MLWGGYNNLARTPALSDFRMPLQISWGTTLSSQADKNTNSTHHRQDWGPVAKLESWSTYESARRKVLVQFVLTSMLIYLVLVLNLPQWALKEIDKVRRGFLWRGRKDARGGHCLLAWPKVKRFLWRGRKDARGGHCLLAWPKVKRLPNLGGLGISHLQDMSWALRLRWLWF